MRRSLVIPAILVLAGCSTPATSAARAARTTSAAHAGHRHEAGVCTAPGGFVVANVGGRDQDGRFVHTPNFRLTGGARRCGDRGRLVVPPGPDPGDQRPRRRTASGNACSATSPAAAPTATAAGARSSAVTTYVHRLLSPARATRRAPQVPPGPAAGPLAVRVALTSLWPGEGHPHPRLGKARDAGRRR